jgi:hypothetical protein
MVRRGAATTVFDGLRRELQPIIEKLLVVEKDTLKRRAPERVDLRTLVDMADGKNYLIRLDAIVKTLGRHVQKMIDDSQESVSAAGPEPRPRSG